MVEPSILYLQFISALRRCPQAFFSLEDPGQGVGPQTIPSWNGVIPVVEASSTNMSKLYDYALSHMWVNVVAQIIGWSS